MQSYGAGATPEVTEDSQAQEPQTNLNKLERTVAIFERVRIRMLYKEALTGFHPT